MHYAAWLARRWDDPAFKIAFPWFDSRRYWDEHVLALREQARDFYVELRVTEGGKPRTIRVPVHMVETMSRVRNVSRQLLQELGREPTLEETARRARTSVDEARRVLAMSRYPISLDRPVGNSEDSHFGDLLPDGGAESPATGASQEMLRNRIDRVLKTLSYREREIIKLRYGLGDGYSYTLEEVGR